VLESKDLSSPEFFTYIASPAEATKVMTTIKLLSAHAEDEQYLCTERQDWLPLVRHTVTVALLARAWGSWCPSWHVTSHTYACGSLRRD
jgi:hypothetical protein